MNHGRRILVTILVIIIIVFSACVSEGDKNTINDEESGIELALVESHDKVRNGARLILAYDAQSKSFQGTVENSTDKILRQVRVEVHLSNGVELGSTTPTDLNPGESIDVTLVANSTSFDKWIAHPEVGVGGSSEGDGAHAGEGESEHNEGGSD